MKSTPTTIISVCVSGQGLQGVRDFDLNLYFQNQATNTRTVDFVHILPNTQHLLFMNGYHDQDKKFYQGIARVKYVKDSSSTDLMQNAKVLEVLSADYQGKPRMTHLEEGPNPVSLSCM